jgi:glycosyltransferase involved in cell wall biosynthesis
MIIGVDATCWANGRGYGRFARELMHAMTRQAPDDTFVCFGDRRALDRWPDPPPNARFVEVRLTESPTVAASADSSRSVSDMLRLTRAVSRERLDVFFSPSVYTYFPLPPRLPVVVTVHDTIPERFPHLTLPDARARFFWSLKVRVALAQARMVLTVSDYSAASISELLRVPRSRIRVCVEAPAEPYRPAGAGEIGAARRKHSLPDESPWFAYVGGFNPHKRVDLILRAHAALATRTPAPHLVLVGDRGGDVFHAEGAKLDAIIRESGTEQLVHWTGFLSDDDLRPVLAGATALLLPSEAEGFGLPAVEAAACGAPVIATTESPLPEILAGGGIFVKPGDLEALGAAMKRLLDDPALQAGLARVALEKASSLSWNDGARQALSAIRESAR